MHANKTHTTYKGKDTIEAKRTTKKKGGGEKEGKPCYSYVTGQRRLLIPHMVQLSKGLIMEQLHYKHPRLQSAAESSTPQGWQVPQPAVGTERRRKDDIWKENKLKCRNADKPN